MGVSTNAVLVYGYDLGGEDDEWLVEETSGEYGELALDWYSEAVEDERDEDEDDEETGFIAAAKRRLIAASGFTETNDGSDGYYDRLWEAEEALEVEFESYCSGESPMYILAAKVITVPRGHVEALDLAAMATDPAEQGWDDKLSAALTTLGITPKQQEPAWLLCSYWG